MPIEKRGRQPDSEHRGKTASAAISENDGLRVRRPHEAGAWASILAVLMAGVHCVESCWVPGTYIDRSGA